MGIALFRTGRINQANFALAKSMKLRKGGDAYDWFILAMIEHPRDPAKAKQCYDKAVAWTEKHQPQHGDLMRFRAEAGAVLGIKATPALEAK